MSLPLRVLLIDDEDLARLRLRSLLAEVSEPATTVTGEAASASEALALLAAAPADLVLLDIHLPGLDGLQLAARLRALPAPPRVVFVTAHPDHALRAFELDAVDYLTKPVRRARLQEALTRVAARLGAGAGAGSGAAPAPAASPAAAAGAPPAVDEAAVLVVSDRGRVRRVPVAELLYLKAELKYVTLRTAEHAFVLDDSLTDLEQRLGDAVIRVHRNALVARKAVRALERRPAGVAAAGVLPAAGTDPDAEGWAVQLSNGEWLAVSRRMLAPVREQLARDSL